MHRTEIRTRWTRLLPVLFLGLALLASPAAADEKICEGEPTDPEGALYLIDAVGIDLDDHGVKEPPATGSEDYDSWYEALIKLLRSLGLLPSEGKDR